MSGGYEIMVIIQFFYGDPEGFELFPLYIMDTPSPPLPLQQHCRNSCLYALKKLQHR